MCLVFSTIVFYILQIAVRLRCNIISVGDIDNVLQEFKAKLYVSVTWWEPLLKGKTRDVSYLYYLPLCFLKIPLKIPLRKKRQDDCQNVYDEELYYFI